MSHQQPYDLGPTYHPGRDQNDYYYPPGTNIVAPAPQRIMHEVPGQIQTNLQRLDLNSTPHSTGATPSSRGPASPSSQYTPSNYSDSPRDPRRAPFNPSSARPLQPNTSALPRLPYRTSNIPESDEEREARLQNDRQPILDSQNYEDQLGWAQEALSYVDSIAEQERRLSQLQPPRPSTPPVERQLRLDSMNIVDHMAGQGHPRALFMKGMWLEFGKFGWKEDRKEAFRLYKAAAANGNSRAEYRMGMLFESTNEPAQALQHYRAGESSGDPASCYRMGMISALGQLGQPQDYGRAVSLIRFAADFADDNAPQGAYVYGMLLARDLPQVRIPDPFLALDIEGAKGYIERSAFLGFSKAQLKMASAYELCTLNCEFNPLLSMHYNILAARQGESEAELAISKWFICGHEGSFSKNEELAFKYAQRAAQTGLPTAEFAMGYFYEIGWYTPKDVEQADYWYRKASQNGNKEASGGLERLSKSSTLSRKDHENIAISRIKSTHASQRGPKPPKLSKPPNNLPTVGDENEPSSAVRPPLPHSQTQPPANFAPRAGSMELPPARSSSVAPYPLDDRPSTTAPVPQAHPPYTQPLPAPSPGGPTGGFWAPQQRPVSEFVDGRGHAQHGATQGYPPGPHTGAPPLRPYQSAMDLGGNNRPAPTPPRPGNVPPQPRYGAGAGTPPVRPPKDPLQAQPPSGHRYPAPMPRTDSRNNFQNSPDLGRRPEPVRPGLAGRKSYEARPGPGQSGQYGAPQPAQSSQALRTNTPPTSRPSSSGRPAVEPERLSHAIAPRATGKSTAAPAKPAGAPNRPPGKGPQTFEEMGVPLGKSNSECTIM